MVIVKKKDIGDAFLIEAYCEMHQTKEKIRFFQGKYQQNFEDFSESMKNNKEDFEQFDDYIEWKAYQKVYNETIQKIEDLKSGNFQVTQ